MAEFASARKMKTLLNIMLGLFTLKAALAVTSRHARQAAFDSYDSANYDVDLDSLNLENQDILDYDDGLTIDEPQIEIGTLPPLEDNYQAPAASLEEEEEEVPLQPRVPSPSSGGSGVFMGPDAPGGMPTCLLCTCLGGSVYCDDVKLENIPPLPKETTHFYARYNKISKVQKSDFAEMNKLKRIDLTGNTITEVDQDALKALPALEELVLRENKMTRLPRLPTSMTLIDVSHNQLGTQGIQKEAFKEMPNLLYLYLTDNDIDYIPVPLPDSLRSLHLQNNNIQMIHEDTFCNLKDLNYVRRDLEDIRLDGNPINLSKTPQAYICLPRLPIGGLV